MEMDWDDLVEWHNVTAFEEDMKAELEMERYEAMDAKHRGKPPYRRVE